MKFENLSPFTTEGQGAVEESMASLAESEKIVGDKMKTPIKDTPSAPYKGVGIVSPFTTAEARDEVEANAFTLSSLKSAQEEIAEEEETKQA